MRFLLTFYFLWFGVCLQAQEQDKIDCIRANVSVIPNALEQTLKGSVTYEFDVLQDVDSIFLDARQMEFITVLLDQKKVKHFNSGEFISIRDEFRKGRSYELEMEYTARPRQTMYFVNWNDALQDNDQIWTQGQGKYTSHWLPSFDDMTEKIEFDISVTFDRNYEVIANGKLVNVQQTDSVKTWFFDMKEPMSSYLLALAIGHYDKQELTSENGTTIENYFYPKDSVRKEPTYRHTKQIFDFLEKEIGVEYPWQNYKQLPVHDFLYAGMENTGCTIFSDGYVVDSIAFVDKSYVNVNAHELAHQWFGNLVTEKSGEHHWLHEGFATYYAYLAEKEIYGEEHFYWKLYGTLRALQNAIDNGLGQSLLNPRSGSLTFYEKGAWALFMLREQIGDAAFRTGIRNYLEKYAFAQVTVSDFIREMEASSGTDLSGFVNLWLENTGMPLKMAEEKLADKSASLKSLFSLLEQTREMDKGKIDFARYWNATNTQELKEYLLQNFLQWLPRKIIAGILDSDDLKLRQALLLNIEDIRDLPREKSESFLDDESYITQENALFKLWTAFPEKRNQYLERTKGVTGLPNKNVRLLWLTLAILTEPYEAVNTKLYFDELSGYTDPMYSYEVRQAAFQYLRDVFGFTDNNLMNLAQATTHHSWQFRKFSRNLMVELLEDDVYKERLVALLGKLKPNERRYIESKVN